MGHIRDKLFFSRIRPPLFGMMLSRLIFSLIFGILVPLFGISFPEFFFPNSHSVPRDTVIPTYFVLDFGSLFGISFPNFLIPNSVGIATEDSGLPSPSPRTWSEVQVELELQVERELQVELELENLNWYTSIPNPNLDCFFLPATRGGNSSRLSPLSSSSPHQNVLLGMPEEDAKL